MKFQLTPALKAYAVKNFGVKKDADDREFRKVIGLKLAAGKLSPKQLVELVKEKGESDKVVADLLERVLKQHGTPAPTPAPSPSPTLKPEDIQKHVDAGIEVALKRMGFSAASAITPESVLSKSESVVVRVKSAAERYSSTKKSAVYPTNCGYKGDGSKHLLAGQPAMFGNQVIDHPSDLDKAVAGAYFKWSIRCSTPPQDIPAWCKMTEHDHDLVNWALRNCEWTGMLKGQCADEGATKVNRRKLNDMEVKALLDDSTSGGIEVAPIAFDDAIILIPILYGELFPLVNVVPVSRGRRMKGGAMSNPTFTSGTAEGTAITAFNTASFVSAFDTTIFPAVAAMEIGLDFEEDSPVAMGNQIIEQYGLQAMAWLDEQIAVGDGTTEPQGVFTNTSTTSVGSDAGPGGPLAVSDFEGLMFGVGKQYRNEPGAACVFLANDTMYRRARAIPVGSDDQRRVFGMDHASYQLLDKPFKINNNCANGRLAFVNLRRYRMYRRLGLTVRIETTGKTLALANTRLIVLRMRWGGQLETGSAAAVMTDAQV